MTGHFDVVLVAHGAGETSAANRDVIERAQRLEQRLTGARVYPAFIRGAPLLDDVLRAASRSARVIIPLFSADGHFVARVRMSAMRHGAQVDTHITPVIGAHPAITEAIVQQILLDESEESTPPVRDVVVLVVGHGTARSASSHLTTRRAAQRIAQRVGKRTLVAFLDQSPTIEDSVRSLPADVRLHVIPFLWGGGEHANDDVPTRVHVACSEALHPPRSVRFGNPISSLAVVDDLLVRLVFEAASASARPYDATPPAGTLAVLAPSTENVT